MQFNFLLFFCHLSHLVSPEGSVMVSSFGIQTLSVNGSVTFTCMALGGPSNDFQWGLDGVDLPGENGTLLSVTGVDAADGGTYRCTASNAAGMDQASALLRGECHKSLLPGVSLCRNE